MADWIKHVKRIEPEGSFRGVRRKGYFFLYSLCFCLAAAMIIFFIVLGGKTFVYINDPFDQDYPVFLYLGKCLREFISGKGLKLYDFSIGLGENVIAPLNLYGFGDPLNLLSVFATVSNARYLYAFLLLFRMYLAGSGMMCYLKKHGFAREMAVGGALMYSFSLFAIVRGFYFYSLLNAMYLFPFLLMLLEELVQDKAEFGSGGGIIYLIDSGPGLL